MIYVIEKVSLNNLSCGLLTALMMEALLISETSVYFCEKTRYHIFKSLFGGWSRVRTWLRSAEKGVKPEAVWSLRYSKITFTKNGLSSALTDQLIIVTE
jgi:hypothetical protein